MVAKYGSIDHSVEENDDEKPFSNEFLDTIESIKSDNEIDF